MLSVICIPFVVPRPMPLRGKKCSLSCIVGAHADVDKCYRPFHYRSSFEVPALAL